MRPGVTDRLRHVESRQNTLVKQLRAAFAKSELTDSGACAMEGERILEEAIRSGLRFEAVFFSESAGNRADRLLPQIGAHVETLLLPDSVFASAVSSETPQGVAALVRLKQFSVEDVLAGAEGGIEIAVAGVQDPGNLGTIIRSAEAFGAAGVFIGERTVSPFNSKVVRASAGSLFRLPLARVKLSEAIAQSRTRGVRWLATSSHKGTPITEVDLSGPSAVLIGSEGPGIPRDLMSQMDETIIIPHAERVESLNAGIAASIVLYEAARQKRFPTESQRHREE